MAPGIRRRGLPAVDPAERHLDTVVDLELFSRFTALLTGFAGANRRVGFHRFHNEGLYRGEMLTHRVAYNPHIHVAKNFIALVDALLATKPEVPYSKTVIGDDEIAAPVIRPPAGAREAMLARLKADTGFDPATQRMVLVARALCRVDPPHFSRLTTMSSW